MRLTGLTWPRGLNPTRTAALTSALLVVAIAWTLAQAVWMFWPGVDGRVGEEASAPLARPAQVAPTYRLQGVADLSLFGAAPMAAASSVEAPQTQLSLTLRGVWANAVLRGKGLAIISAGDGSENAYKVGDPLPGGAILEQVLPDRVILKRSGRSEALFLPKESMGGSGVAAAELMPQGGRSEYRADSAGGGGDLGVRMQEYRQRILNDPQEAFSLARMQPVMEDGKLKGYKLSPNKEKVLFREIGLRPGDVVTSVNGLALSDPAAAGQVMTQISSASQITLTVDRGGRPETIVVPIGQ